MGEMQHVDRKTLNKVVGMAQANTRNFCSAWKRKKHHGRLLAGSDSWSMVKSWQDSDPHASGGSDCKSLLLPAAWEQSTNCGSWSQGRTGIQKASSPLWPSISWKKCSRNCNQRGHYASRKITKKVLQAMVVAVGSGSKGKVERFNQLVWKLEIKFFSQNMEAPK